MTTVEYRSEKRTGWRSYTEGNSCRVLKARPVIWILHELGTQITLCTFIYCPKIVDQMNAREGEKRLATAVIHVSTWTRDMTVQMKGMHRLCYVLEAGLSNLTEDMFLRVFWWKNYEYKP